MKNDMFNYSSLAELKAEFSGFDLNIPLLKIQIY